MKKKSLWMISISLCMILSGFIIWIFILNNQQKTTSSTETKKEKKIYYQCFHGGTISLEDVQLTADFERRYDVVVNDQDIVLSKTYIIQYDFANLEDLNVYYNHVINNAEYQKKNYQYEKVESEKRLIMKYSLPDDEKMVGKEYIKQIQEKGFTCISIET